MNVSIKYILTRRRAFENYDASGRLCGYAKDMSFAFTIIELMLVISIVCILASLLMTALAKSKAQAKSIVCTGNLRQHGLAMKMYEADYGQYVCQAESIVSINSQAYFYATWWHSLLFYCRSNIDLYYCPSNPKIFRIASVAPWKEWDHSTNHLIGMSYGYNVFGSGQPDYYRLLGFGQGGNGFSRPFLNLRDEDIAAPSDFITIGDSQSDFWGDYEISAMCDSDSIKHASWPGDRHNRGANIVFVDGHVENKTQKKWLEKTPEARRRWNFDNQPHPETWHDRIAPQ